MNTPLHRARRVAGYRTSDDFADAIGLDRHIYRACEEDPDFPYGHGRYVWDIFENLGIDFSINYHEEG